MLAGMLLHVIETALPVDNAANFGGLHGRGYLMRDPVVFVDNFDDIDAAQLPDVEGLTTGRGIKRRAIEINPEPVRTLVDHTGWEFGQVAVVVIKPIGH